MAHKAITIHFKYRDRPEKTYNAPGDEVIIGRAQNIPNHLDLSPDQKVSRLHARLFYDLSTWWVEDLESKHRTLLNKCPITERTTLTQDSKLQLGDTSLRLNFTGLETLPPETLPPLETIDSHYPVDEVEPPPGVPEDQRLEFLARIATIVATAPSREALLEQFIDLIGQVLPQAERRTIALIDDDRELLPRTCCPPGPAKISYTLAHRAIRSKQTLMWARDLSDGGEQIPSLHDTIAALCAPIILNGRVIGVVYADSTKLDAGFAVKELDLLTEIATTMARPIKAYEGQSIPSIPSAFISYAPADRELVNSLAADLRRRRIKVWFDERLRVGDDGPQKIREAIKATDCFVMVLSPESVMSDQVGDELKLAQQTGKKILPVIAKPCEPPDAIGSLVPLDLSADYYLDSLEQLAEVINDIPKSALVDFAGVAANAAKSGRRESLAIAQVRPGTASVELKPQTHILMLAANPRDTKELRLPEEARTIEERLNEAAFRDRFEVTTKWAVRYTDLQHYLMRYKPHIVHFSGHGSKSGEIILEEEGGQSHAIKPEALRKLFRILKDNLRCVVLNACLSAIQADAIVHEIDCVVGMADKIGDDSAIRFAGGFYRALCFGRSVQTAFELGCNEIGLAQLDEETKPRLFVRPGVRASDVYFI